MPSSDPKMKKCKARPRSFSISKVGFLRVFEVHPGFRFFVPEVLPVKVIRDVTRL